jgi:hypothetical protein
MILNTGSWWELCFYSYRPYIGVPHHFFWYRLADTASFLSIHHVLHCRVCSWGILVSVPSFPSLEKTQGPYLRNGFSCVSYCVVSNAITWKFQDMNKAPISYRHENTTTFTCFVCLFARMPDICLMDHGCFISECITVMWMCKQQISCFIFFIIGI